MANWIDSMGTAAPTAAGVRGSLGLLGVGKNLIINGDFDIWQRGTSFAAIAAEAFSADRWQYNKSGSMAHTISRDTDVPTVAQSGHLSNYSLKVDCTTADTDITASNESIIQHKIEGYNFKRIAQRTFTISFWVKATKTGTYCVSFINSGADRSYVAEYVVNASDTWEKKTITVSASPAAGTWNYINGVGLRITWMLAGGTDYQTTKDAWQTGYYFCTSNQVNACDSTDNNFWLSQVQIEDGSVATEFESRDVGTEVRLCKRYFQKSYRIETAPSTNTLEGAWYSNATTDDGQNLWFTIMLDGEMRAAPTITFINYTGVDANWKYKRSGVGSTDIAMTAYASGLGTRSFMCYTAALGAAWAAALATGHWTAEAEL